MIREAIKSALDAFGDRQDVTGRHVLETLERTVLTELLVGALRERLSSTLEAEAVALREALAEESASDTELELAYSALLLLVHKQTNGRFRFDITDIPLDRALDISGDGTTYTLTSIPQ